MKPPCKGQIPPAVILLAVDLLDNHAVSPSWPGIIPTKGHFPSGHIAFPVMLNLQSQRVLHLLGSEVMSTEFTYETLIKGVFFKSTIAIYIFTILRIWGSPKDLD